RSPGRRLHSRRSDTVFVPARRRDRPTRCAGLAGFVTDRLYSDHRRAELAANLEAVRARIDAACAEAGRTPSDVTLIAVTKTFPASDVELLAALGIRDVGENRDQEAAAKVAE